MVDEGRDTKGRFTKGNKIGIGRPRRSVEEKYLKCLRDNVSLEDFKVMVQQALKKAKGGDVALFKLLLNYLIGLPTQYTVTDVTSGGKPLKAYTVLANPDMWPDAE
jgi:hypothetical protein